MSIKIGTVELRLFESIGVNPNRIIQNSGNWSFPEKDFFLINYYMYVKNGKKLCLKIGFQLIK